MDAAPRSAAESTERTAALDVHHAAALCYDRMAKKHIDDFACGDTPFRSCNNFVKKSLVQLALDKAHARGVQNVVVLDLASGRGGDLFKWASMQSPRLCKATMHLSRDKVAKASEYHCYDISSESIAAAQVRADSRSPDKTSDLSCSFSVANCFDSEFIDGELRKHPRFGMFDVVSVQFAFHYACSSLQRVRMVLAACFDALAPGGVFVATIVDSTKVKKHLNPESRLWAGAKFSIQFVDASAAPAAGGDDASINTKDKNDALVLGTPYHFLLEDFVDCQEYFVPIEELQAIAHSVGFSEDEGKSFDMFVASYHADGRNLALTPDDRELVSLYRTVVLTRPMQK